MAYEPIDAYYEELEQSAYEHFYEQYQNSDHHAEDLYEAVEEFIEERLRSFYLRKPTVVQPPLALLKEAKELYQVEHFSAAQVFAGAAIEVTFKEAILKPIVYGFVLSDTMANLIVEIFAKSVREIDRFKVLLLHIIETFGEVNLDQLILEGANKTVWQQAKEVGEQRNQLLHKAKQATKEDAEQSLSIADYVTGKLFPQIITNLDLRLDASYQVLPMDHGNVQTGSKLRKINWEKGEQS